MESQLPLQEVMPLFSPIYDPTAFSRFAQLKQRMQNKVFDAQTNLLAEQILQKEPSNYTGWYCKKMHILSNPNIDIEHEYQFADSCLGEKAKSFQVWEQKRFLLQYHNQPQREMAVSREVIENVDSKNYHAWSFRTWLVEQEGDWKKEMQFAEEMIEQDCFNNSAWAYRFFLVRKSVEGKSEEERRVVAEREVGFALENIEAERSNRASWNYLRGLFPAITLKDFSSKNALRSPLISSYAEYPQVEECCQRWWKELKQISGENTESKSEGKGKGEKIRQEAARRLASEREVLSTLVHIYSQKEENKQFAVSLCDELAEKQPQRIYYWKWVQNQL